MKSIRDLNNNYSDRQHKAASLASIQKQQNPFKTRRQKAQVQCAFHPNQIITNFCKNLNCLLPLCPKCVKIHVQEHTQLGNFAKIQIIDECLNQAHDSIYMAFNQASQLQKIAIQLQQNHAKKRQQTLRELQKAKFVVLQRVADVFKEFQQAIKVQLNRQDRLFSEQLIQYHNLMNQMMQTFRNSSKKLTNKSSLMQGLISYYSKGDFPIMLRECQQKINKITVNRIQVQTKQYQLDRFEEVIRRYFRIGENGSQQRISSQNRLYPAGGINRQYSYNNQSLLVTKSNNKHQKNGEDVDIYGSIQNLKTPLDKFNLELSRNTRMVLDRKKTANNSY